MTGRAWFVPHRYGIGASPSTWQGWAVTAGFVLAVLALSAILPPRGDGQVSAVRMGVYLGLVAALSLGFVRLAMRRTDGAWRWRWGARRKD